MTGAGGNAPPALPPTCEIRNWTVFGPGFHKEDLYSLAECLRMGEHFRRLSTGATPLVEPSVKIGHDRLQRLVESMGFPRFGAIAGCRIAPNGLTTIDCKGIPTQIGQALNAGLFKDGSIEIAPPLPDPDDPAKKLYPVLTAVALLGEEQPAVPLRFPIPKAVFADGTEVPAAIDLTPWFKGMAEAVKTFSAPVKPAVRFNGREYETRAVCFSAMTPVKGNRAMNPELLAKLQAAVPGLTPEQYQALAGCCGSTMATAPAPAPPGTNPDPFAKFAADPNTPEYAKTIMSAFSAFTADATKRFGALEAEATKDKDKLEAAAAFASEYRDRVKADKKATVTRDVDRAVLDGKLDPRDRSAFVNDGLTKDMAKTFAAGHASAGKTEYEVWRDELHARTPSSTFRQDPALAGKDPGNPLEDRFVRETLAQMGQKGRELVAGAK